MTAQSIRTILLAEAAHLVDEANQIPPGYEISERRLERAADGLIAITELSDNDVLRFRELIVGP